MALYTLDYFRTRFNNNKGLFENKSHELITETRLFSESIHHRWQFDIFLSHTIADKDVIRGVFLELTEMGYKTYVDWIIDPQLDRANVTRETANLVRKRMKQSDSLFHATSDNSSRSKWMPWETGWKDGNNKKVCIFPIVGNFQEKYQGQEFLSLYPYIIKDDYQGAKRLFVVDPETGRKELYDNWM
jgi:hypothetical protein